MGTMLTVLYYRFLRNVRDRSYFAEIVLYPLVLILVLGSALGGVFEPRNVRPIPVTYVVSHDDEVSRELHEFFHRDDVQGYLTPIESSSLDEARSRLASFEAVSAVYVEHSGDTVEVTILERSDAPLGSGIIRAVVGNFVLGANVYEVLNRYGASGKGYQPVRSVFKETAVSRTGRIPRAFDFYSISMLVMTIMFAASFSADGMKEILQDTVSIRTRSTTSRQGMLLLGTMAAYWVTTLLQITAVIIITAVLFQVQWLGNPLLLVLVTTSLALFAVALGGFVFSLTRDSGLSQSLITAIVLGSLFLSGGAFQLGPPGPVLSTIRQVLPNYQGQRALLEMMFGSSPGTALAASIGFAAAGAVLFLCSALMMKFRRAAV